MLFLDVSKTVLSVVSFVAFSRAARIVLGLLLQPHLLATGCC